MTDCIFCAIGAGEIPSAELWQNDHVFAFLDINPLRPGHALVIPKRHAATHAALDEPTRNALWASVAHLTEPLCKAVGAKDATIAINDGPAAGQEIPHCHVHIVPRQSKDGAGPIHALFQDRPTMTHEEIHDIAIRIQAVA